MFAVFFIGTAGSGKSLLTSSFTEWLKREGADVVALNLDPGALSLPYTPDIDIREHVKVEQIMERYGLGPNGALIMAADLIADEAERIGEELEDFKADIAIIDTPGQMELFAFRASGPYIAKELTKGSKAIVYLFDSVFSLDPLNYVSNMFLSAAVYNRFFIPQLHLLSKCDLLPSEEVTNVVEWSTTVETLEQAIEEKLSGTKHLLSRDVMRVIYQLGLSFLLIPVSAKTNEGLIDLNAALQRVFTGGEKFSF